MSTSILGIIFFQKYWHWINELDTKLFLLINTEFTNSFLDKVYPWWREGNTWMPLYLFIIIFLLVNFKQKALGWILFAIITIAIADQLSSHLIKPFFERPRPCNDPMLMHQIRLLLNGCSGGFSFTSSHATNHFSFAVFVLQTLGFTMGKWKYLLILWAATIAYGQVYVGVHYPLDILVGTILGISVGLFTSKIFHQFFGFLSIELESQTNEDTGR